MQLVLPERKFWASFRQMQGRRPQYLKPGDVMAATIASADRVIDPGEQRIRVAQQTAAPPAGSEDRTLARGPVLADEDAAPDVGGREERDRVPAP